MGDSTVAIAVFLADVAPNLANATELNLQNLLGADKLYFDKLICKNVGPTHPTVIMSETISKSMAEALTTIKALPDADQFRPSSMK